LQILPAAVVAPLFFRGEIEFGVINQSASGETFVVVCGCFWELEFGVINQSASGESVLWCMC